jgi:hypothetical protein
VGGAVGAGSLPGGATGGARSGVLCLGEGRTKPGLRWQGQDSRSRGEGLWVGRGLVGRRWAGRRRAGRRRVGRRRAGRGRRVGQQPPPWPIAGDGAPRCEVYGEAVAVQRFLERAAEIHLGAPNWSWVRHPAGE